MSPMKHLFIIGTRPEVIKCAPVVHELISKGHFVQILTTGQHLDLVDPLMSFFGMSSDYHLSVDHDGDHHLLLASIQERLVEILSHSSCDLVWVQGDTTTALAGGLSAKASQKSLAHIEAGLRSFQCEPYPEESNRVRLAQLADYHFCPTSLQADNLLKEGVFSGVFVTGNTVIDSLQWTQKKLLNVPLKNALPTEFSLLTCHRSEWKHNNFDQLCLSLKEVYSSFPDNNLVFPVHPSPEIHNVAYRILSDVENIYLLPPCSYPDFVHLMMYCHFIMTDSGGVQEEAPTVNKPVFVLRNSTERPEIISCGAGVLWGRNPHIIADNLRFVLENPSSLKLMEGKLNPFGNGDSAKRIVSCIMGDNE